MKNVIMYLNQFFGQIGGEDKADYPPAIENKRIGPATALNGMLKGGEITHTVICGDNFMTTNQDDALEQVGKLLEGLEFDLFLTGPAFMSGRYGVSCAQVCKYVKDRFGVPVITSMFEENPGVELYRQELYIMKGGDNARVMGQDLTNMAALANKLLNNEPLKGADAEGYFGRGIIREVFHETGAILADRAMDMLIKKLTDQPFETELRIKKTELVPFAAPLTDTGKAKIALVSTGGIVPMDNPDKIPSASATRWGRYDISKMDRLEAGEFKSVHAGYNIYFANANPNVVAPLDAARALEREGKIGSLYPYFFSTTGNYTNVKESIRMAQEMIVYLQEDKVDGVIFVST